MLGCTLILPGKFVLAYDIDGNLSASGKHADGSIAVMRYKDVNWGTPETMPDKTYETSQGLAVRKWKAGGHTDALNITDRHNVLLFLGEAAKDWKVYLKDCSDESARKQDADR